MAAQAGDPPLNRLVLDRLPRMRLVRPVLVSAFLLAASTAPSTLLAQGGPLPLTPPASGQKTPAPRAPAEAPASQGGPAKPPAAAETTSETVDRVNAYLNGVVTLIGDFTQVGADGRRDSGKLYIQRPGKLRFDYKKPNPIEVVSDGKSVSIRDTKVNTQELVAIGQTPLKFLLAQRIDLARDTRVLGVSRNPNANTVTVSLEDRSTLGGTSRIRLIFNDGPDVSLRQWTITDPQGTDTQVSLANLETGRRLDPSLFTIDYTVDPLKR